MENETYKIRIEVRDLNNKLIKDDKGFKTTGIVLELKVASSLLERELTAIGNTLKAWMPDNKITVSANLFNSISQTYMEMAVFIENRFIKL